MFCITIFMSCQMPTKNENQKQTAVPIIGTWQLISGTLIEKGDTVVTDYTKKTAFIKIINDTHLHF